MDAVTVAVLVPALIGVPLIAPLVAIERPPGRLVAVKMIGAVPLAITVLLNATPTVPLKELAEVIAGAPSTTKMTLEVAVPNAFEALRVTEWLPNEVGVPAIMPFDEFVKPGGRLLAISVNGAEPQAENEKLVGRPISAFQLVVERIVGAS